MEKTDSLAPLDAALRAELVVDAIERSILRGEIEAGQRLAERELAEQLGVSKTPVREALKELGRRGLVVSVPYRGAHVRAVDPEQARNIYSVRLLLEPEAVRLATREQTDETVAACHAALADAADAAEHGEVADISLANRRFHRSLYLPCPNNVLVEFLDAIQDRVAMISVSAWRRDATWSNEADEHAAILAAVTARDGEHASALLHAHIERFLQGAVSVDTAATVEAVSE